MKRIAVMGQAGSGKDSVAGFVAKLNKDGGTVSIALAAPLKDFCEEVFQFTREQLWGSSEERNRIDPRFSTTRKGLVGKAVRWWNRETYLGAREICRMRFMICASRWLDQVLPPGKDRGEAYVRLTAWLSNVLEQEHITARYALQTLGTEFGRHIDADIWVDALLREVDRMAEDKNIGVVIVTDCRFINEAKKLRKAGFQIWALVRPGQAGPTGGASNHASEKEQTSPEMRVWTTATIENTGTLADLYVKVRGLLESI